MCHKLAYPCCIFASRKEAKNILNKIIMKSNEKEEYYEYLQLTVYDEDGQSGWDVWLDQLLDDSIGDRTKEEKIDYLNAIIRDIEHYRDSLL